MGSVAGPWWPRDPKTLRPRQPASLLGESSAVHRGPPSWLQAPSLKPCRASVSPSLHWGGVTIQRQNHVVH